MKIWYSLIGHFKLSESNSNYQIEIRGYPFIYCLGPNKDFNTYQLCVPVYLHDTFNYGTSRFLDIGHYIEDNLSENIIHSS